MITNQEHVYPFNNNTALGMYSWIKACECMNLLQEPELSTCTSNSSSSSSVIIETQITTRITLDENYIDKLIDLELRNVPSTLGLVWSKLSCHSNPNEFLFQTNPSSQTSNECSPSVCNNIIISNNQQEEIDLNMKPVSRIENAPFCVPFHQPESSLFKNKISKKRKQKKDKPNYRVRFSYNKFEEIEFRKSNPKGKFIIFK
ncbi:predicted protein [Naegleria gruberi]|uniref:Predicted protein n=1 Tax=Naegleria gruberi TaxID=5762 RepID=D2VQ44_NAEGR|nr:uncharacterized protein NAEGRDRAFT_71159 [Naegleria gruberi]EFC41120.1 predicted protein [Naegleria gruberi]|eukprot:XP_002673864.1 predicted protein [Naegleria gruberi strain NEG-M]